MQVKRFKRVVPRLPASQTAGPFDLQATIVQAPVVVMRIRSSILESVWHRLQSVVIDLHLRCAESLLTRYPELKDELRGTIPEALEEIKKRQSE